jgi:hypothetical protein
MICIAKICWAQMGHQEFPNNQYGVNLAAYNYNMNGQPRVQSSQATQIQGGIYNNYNHRSQNNVQMQQESERKQVQTAMQQVQSAVQQVQTARKAERIYENINNLLHEWYPNSQDSHEVFNHLKTQKFVENHQNVNELLNFRNLNIILHDSVKNYWKKSLVHEHLIQQW